jgi:hypothetical protein
MPLPILLICEPICRKWSCCLQWECRLSIELGSTAVSNQDGLDPKEFDDLIVRLSRRKQETPSAQIPFQDVKDILQQEGLLESLLKEHVSSRNQAVEAMEQKNKQHRSLLTKGFAVLSVALAGLSGFGGYSIGSKLATDSAGQTSLTAQTAYSEKNKSLETKVGDLEGQVKAKDDQIKELISKVGTASPSPSAVVSPMASSSAPPVIAAAATDTEFDSGSVILQGCNRSGKAVKCSLSITSKVDQEVGVGNCYSDSKTRFFDPQGGEHKAAVVEFGKRFSNSGCTVETALIKDVPAKAILTFNDISLETKTVKALEISISTKSEKGTEWRFPQYRDVPIK